MMKPAVLSEAKIFLDFRRGDLKDLSNYGNDGSFTSTPTFSNNGIKLGSGKDITVADDSSIDSTEGCCIMLSDFEQPEGTTSFNLWGKEQYVYGKGTSSNSIHWNDGASNPSLSSAPLEGIKCVGINFKNGEKPDVYYDGLLKGTMNATATVTSGSTDFKVGSTSNDLIGYVKAIVYFTRELTATEHAEVFGYLSNIQPPMVAHSKLLDDNPNLLKDGDMEDSGTSDWTASNSTLTKETSNPHSGGKSMRATNSGAVAGGATQSIIKSGKLYRCRGWARGDGTNHPFIYFNSKTHWTGTSSTDWQYFDFTHLATTNTYFGVFNSGSSAGDWFEIDDINAVEVGKVYSNGWKSDWGTPISPASIASGYVEKTPFKIKAGSLKVDKDTIDGVDVKVIKASGNTDFVMPAYPGQTPTESLVGTHEFWIYPKVVGSANSYIVLNDTESANLSVGNNYNITIYYTGDVYIRRGSSLLTSAYTIDMDKWHKFNWSITSAGAMSLKMDDVEILTCTDATYSSINYLGFRLQAAGQMIAYSDIKGDYSTYKKVT